MLHHVSLEVEPDDVGRTVELFELLGFERVPAIARTWAASRPKSTAERPERLN